LFKEAFAADAVLKIDKEKGIMIVNIFEGL
jgi:hypothetical protein